MYELRRLTDMPDPLNVRLLRTSKDDEWLAIHRIEWWRIRSVEDVADDSHNAGAESVDDIMENEDEDNAIRTPGVTREMFARRRTLWEKPPEKPRSKSF